MTHTSRTKSATTHTPGPWVHCAPIPKLRPTHEIRNTEGVIIAYLNCNEDVHEVIANARLIAAAPVLLQTLHDAEAFLQGIADNDSLDELKRTMAEKIIKRNRAAIAEAKAV